MPKARTVLTDAELIAYSKEHLQYEISMLVGCAHLLGRPFQSDMPEVAQIFRNVVVESFAIHVRNVVDFLYPNNVKPTDVLADDFFPQGMRSPAFPSLSSKLREARERAHKQVSHLTTGRLSGNVPGKAWAIGDLVKETLKVLTEFARHASPSKLDDSVRQYVLTIEKQLNSVIRNGERA